MSEHEVTVDVPEYPKGHRVETSFGIFENGETKKVEISDEAAEKIRDGDVHGISVKGTSRSKTTVTSTGDSSRNEGGEQ